MSVRLRPDVRFALWGDDLVVLDIGEDQYALLAGVGAEMAPVLGDAAVWHVSSPGLRATLSEAGWLSDLDATAQTRPPPLLPQRSFDDQGFSPLSFPQLLSSGLAFKRACAACASFESRPLQSLLGEFAPSGRSPSRPEPRWEASLPGLIQRFLELSPYAPGEGACLRRAYLLMRYLRFMGLRAVWVFGVRAWPFRAHCWVQWRDMALGEAPEKLAQFAPILAV